MYSFRNFARHARRTPLTLQLAVVFALMSMAGPAFGQVATSDSLSPPARAFHDVRSGVSFQIPAGWNLSMKDGEVSTFRLDARSAGRTAQMRGLASIGFNPYPESTLSGAFFYVSVAPRVTPSDCAQQASLVAPRTASVAQVGGTAFQHGYDEHGGVCTEARDEIYTATRKGSCYRFDLIINSFCGGDVSGVRDVTAAQIEAVRHRLETILASVRFD
jgi:hypothetical protein